MVSQNLAWLLVALGVFLILILIVCAQCACLGPAFRHLICGCIDGGASARAIFAPEEKDDQKSLLQV